ncbi:techylectin-5A [Nephila pilipes]|uniref:Techylectin-5A n=1 Tax=Nephila pilipes TaxID=299642 RepID=A0A8X6P8F9_NEPPI|nr:techylectin-5A [Nephila pilipes]
MHFKKEILDTLDNCEIMMKILLLFAVVLVLILPISAAKLEKLNGATSTVHFAEADGKEQPPKCKKHSKPMDCQEVMDNGNTESGVYTIWPRSRERKCQSIDVYCDMETAGGGWTVSVIP